ncbi:hypothetical protein HGA88_03290 [Candidatus Roizmanbacteria bacterium]|nr:hypothetical protein [Candidatus Roizmanbacteria bacterium]
MILYALVAADLLMAFAFVMRFSHLPPQIPLFYSRAWGEDQLGDMWFLFLPVLFLHVFVFLNTAIFQRFFLVDPLIKKINIGLNWLFLIACLFAFLKIIFTIS